jgi:hypothetical protein
MYHLIAYTLSTVLVRVIQEPLLRPLWGIIRVCGRALGYQFGDTDAFFANGNGDIPINEPYVDGLSITYGSPRQHIWTFAAGHEISGAFPHNCPCAAHPGVCSISLNSDSLSR